MIMMHTFYGDDGNFADIPLPKILDRLTDEFIDNEICGENISELRDACRQLLDRAGIRAGIPKTPEPSGLWACWFGPAHDTQAPVISVSKLSEIWPNYHGVQLPASMTAREIAALTVGDCRRMKGK